MFIVSDIYDPPLAVKAPASAFIPN